MSFVCWRTGVIFTADATLFILVCWLVVFFLFVRLKCYYAFFSCFSLSSLSVFFLFIFVSCTRAQAVWSDGVQLLSYSIPRVIPVLLLFLLLSGAWLRLFFSIWCPLFSSAVRWAVSCCLLLSSWRREDHMGAGLWYVWVHLFYIR